VNGTAGPHEQHREQADDDRRADPRFSRPRAGLPHR